MITSLRRCVLRIESKSEIYVTRERWECLNKTHGRKKSYGSSIKNIHSWGRKMLLRKRTRRVVGIWKTWTGVGGIFEMQKKVRRPHTNLKNSTKTSNMSDKFWKRRTNRVCGSCEPWIYCSNFTCKFDWTRKLGYTDRERLHLR